MILRKICISTLFIFVFGWIRYALFREYNFMTAIPLLFILFGITPLFVLEMQEKLNAGHYMAINIGCAFITIFIGSITDIFFIIAILLFHIGIAIHTYFILDELHNRRFVTLRSILHSGAYSFVLTMTISLSSLSLAVFSSFTLTCDQVYTYANSIIHQINPIGFEFDYVWESFSTRPLPQVLGLPLQQSNTIATGNNIGILLSNTGSIDTNTGIVTNHDTQYNRNNDIGILGRVEIFKQRLIDQVMADNSLINKNICDILIEHISQKFNQPVFQFSVLFLLFILISPIARLILFIFEIIFVILYKILLLIGVYTLEDSHQDIEILK